MLDDLSFRVKLALIALLATVPGIALLFLLNREMSIRITTTENELHGTAYLQPMRHIQENLEVYRLQGLTGGKASTDSSDVLAGRIDTAFGNLQQLGASAGAQIGAQSRISALQERWDKIKNDQSSVSLYDSDERFDAMNKELRRLIAYIGDDSDLILDPQLDSYYMMDATVLRLPQLQDTLSDAQKISLKAARRGNVTPEESTQLTILGGAIRTEVENLQQSMGVGFRNNPADNLEKNLSKPLESFSLRCESFVRLIEANFHEAGPITIKPDQILFSGADARVNGYDLWDSSIDLLKQLLGLRIRSFEVSKMNAFLGALVIMLLSAIVVFQLSGRLSNRVGTLARVSNRIAQNPQLSDSDEKMLANISSGDEIGALSKSVHHMAKQLGQHIADLKKGAEKIEEYNRTLEERVAARTNELQSKNKELEKALSMVKEAQRRLIVQEKMASLGSLTAGIAHEIKNPLNFVNNFSQLSVELIAELREIIKPELERLSQPVREDVDGILTDIDSNVHKINEHGNRADRIVRGMLDHSRGKAGERQLVELNTLLKEYTNLAYHGLRSQDSTFNITIEESYDPKVGTLAVVPQDLSRVILNLVNNACQSSHSKKKALGDGFAPTLKVKSTDLGERVEIRVRDNGKGIKKEHLDRIFEPFFTTKPTGEGTGLGLSISYDIVVQQHGGEFRVESVEGEYAEFILIIPKKVAKVNDEQTLHPRR
ncbi:hypothetical protein BH09SUM1_BH09SUM1_26220 [soil metagenome]